MTFQTTQRGMSRAAAYGPGSRFWVKKTMTSSDILTASAVDITGVSDGQLAIVDVVVKSDATGLAGMTNLELKTNNAKGLLNFFVTAASGLASAVKTVDLANASVTKIKTILESGKKVQVQGSASIGTGSGTIDIWLCFERIDEKATIAAA